MKKLTLFSSIFFVSIFSIIAQTIVGPTTVCAGDVTSYSISVINTWSSLGTQQAVPGYNTFSVLWGNSSSGQITVIAEDSTGQVIYTGGITVSIKEKPNTVVTSNSISSCSYYGEEQGTECWVVCEGSTVTYTAALHAGDTYNWI